MDSPSLPYIQCNDCIYIKKETNLHNPCIGLQVCTVYLLVCIISIVLSHKLIETF